MEHTAPRNHVRFHSRLSAQHANHVLRLRSRQCRGGFIPILGNPSASRHRLYSCTFPLMRKNTSGDAVASPEVLPFWLDDPLLLLRGFLRGLLRGCLLGCFLSCHLPILPFRWFASSSATFVAVEECIDSCVLSVKKKTTMRVEKVATIFSDRNRPLRPLRSQNVMRMEKRDRQSRNCIVPAVSKNSCAQISSKQCKQTEERAEHREQKHRSRSFVPMRRTKHHC